MEQAHRNRKKNKKRSWPIGARFSFYKDKMNILKNCKKLKNTGFSIFVQESFENFENLKFDSFESKDVLLDGSNDPVKTFIITCKSLTRNFISHQSFYSYLKSLK